MSASPSIRSYDITCGEQVEYGYYAALEVVFKQYLSELESFFFDAFNLTFDLDFDIRTGLKFKEYLNGIKQPSPIFIFELPPLRGKSLLVMENLSANLILSKDKLNKKGKVAIGNRFQINANNYRSIQPIVEELIGLFARSWQKIFKVETKLKKLVSNRIKAKVLNPVEACILVRIDMKHKDLATFWEFCFSSYQLDWIMKKYGSKALLAESNGNQQDQNIKEYFTRLLLEESTYELRGILGKLRISQKELVESYNTQTVLPLKNDLNKNAVVYLNDAPVLSANVGTTNKNLALQVNGKFEKVKGETKQKKRPFTELQFPFQ